MPIDKCPDKDAYLEISVKSTFINQASGSDTMSMMSGMDNMSCDSGPDTEFNFGDMNSRMSRVKKADHQQVEQDIDDLEKIGVGDERPITNTPKLEEKRKQFSSYRKRLAANAMPKVNVDNVQPIEEEKRDQEETIDNDIAGINAEIEELEKEDEKLTIQKP